MAFSEVQKRAIEHLDGPMMVLAGPGSGKTTVITRRVRWLIESAGVNPANILVATYTKAAAMEMKERFLHLMGNKRVSVNFGTLHSVCFTILKQAYHYSSANIIMEDKKFHILKEIVDEEGIELDDEADFISGVLNEISVVKGTMISLEHYYSINCSEEVFKKIYISYQNKIKNLRLIDFDDMLLYTYELLDGREDILAAWQQKFKYILIDEFQDINLLQYMIIRLLAGKTANLFIVGDDDQSIYKFRGANPEIMLNFKNDYRKAKEVILNINYRCNKNIVEASKRVIQNNKNRYSKNLEADKKIGGPVSIKSFHNQADEYRWLIKEINDYHQIKKIPLSQMAILFRTNMGSGLLLEKLMEYNIPFKAKDMLPNIYEHWIAKNISAYMRVAAGKGKRQDLLQIVNRPNRFISREYLKNQDVTINDLKQSYRDKDWMVKRLEQLSYDMELLKSMPPYAAINYIRFGIGYEAYLINYANERRMNKDDLIEILDELQERAKPFPDMESWFAHIDEYGKLIKKRFEDKKDETFDGVSLITMHSAKGLEFEVVFVIDVLEGVVPHQKAVMESDIEEERRMFYVALTRAKDYLHVYYPKERFAKKTLVSRFVCEILPEEKQSAL